MQKFILFLCMIWAVSLQAQQFNVDFSNPAKIENDVTDFHRYGVRLYSDKTNWGNMQFALTANLKKVKYGVKLTQYDEQLKELKTLSLDDGKKDFGPFKPLIHYGTNAIYVMYFRFIDDDKVKMYVSKVNPDDLSVVITKEVMEYDQKNQGFWGSVKTIEDTQSFYTVSDDGKTAWIVSASPKLIVSSVIDGDLNLIQKTESAPVKLDKLLITGAQIDDAGNKVLIYRYDDPALKEFYARGLFFQSANTPGSFTAVKFPNGFFPGNLTLQQSKDGKKLYLGGEYFGENYSSGGKGVLLAEVNIASHSVSTPAFYPYNNDIRQRVFDLGFASKSKGDIVFTDHHLNYEINEMKNGTLVLSADMETSYKGPIIHVFVMPGGNVAMNLIPKSQILGAATNFFNYIYKDKLICIYSDLQKFQEKEVSDNEISRSQGGTTPVANIYNSEGKLLERKILIDNKNKMKGKVLIGNGSKIGDNKFLFPVGESKVNMVKYYTSVNQICYLEIL